MQIQQHIESTIIALSGKIAVGGGTAAAVSGAAAKAGYVVSVTDATSVIGCVCAVFGIAVNVYFQHQRNNREKLEAMRKNKRID